MTGGDVGALAWYVIHSKPRKEGQVSAYLDAQGLETFYPTVRVQPVNPRAARMRSYFPGYLFVRADLEAVGVSALQWVPGAIRLVQFGGEPARVPDNVIAELKRHVRRVNAGGGLTLHGLKPGDVVRITHGPLAGYEAVFDLRLSGSERVQVLLEMLGRQVRVRVDAGAIEKRRAG